MRAVVSGDRYLRVFPYHVRPIEGATLPPMSYMRGANYIWSDGSRFHFWISDGGDDWLGACAPDGAVTEDAEAKPAVFGGVSIAEEVMDDFVVMRFAELLLAGTAADAILRAIERYDGNFGCASLVHAASWLLPSIRAMPLPNVPR